MKEMISTIKLSPFLHFIKLNSKEDYAVYNSLFIKKFFCDKRTLNKIKDLQIVKDKKLFSYLFKNRFIIDKNIKPENEIDYLINNKKIDFKKPFFKVFYMIVTTGCNFRCKYCYLSSLIDYKARVMSLDKSKMILDYFYSYIKKIKNEVPKLVLYGGEPLLNKKVIKFIIKDVRKNIKNKRIPFTNIILITNGSLLNDNIIKFLKKNKVLIAVSLDGPKNINDKNRLYVNGESTYDDTVRAISLLNRNNIKPTLSCTINQGNVKKLNEIIPWMIKNFEIDSLGLNLFSGGDCSNKVIKRLSNDSAKEIIKVFRLCREYGIYEDTVLRQMKAFVEENPNIYYCAATGREISVDPDGNLATCPAFLNTKLFPINVDQNLKVEDRIEFKKWVKRSPILNKKCYKCIALGVCGGGCAFNSYKNHNNIYELDTFFCNYAKNITFWMLKDLYNITKEHK